MGRVPNEMTQVQSNVSEMVQGRSCVNTGEEKFVLERAA